MVKKIEILFIIIDTAGENEKGKMKIEPSFLFSLK